MDDMKNLAIITARGGSKRIPGKNIKEFCGKPIIAYAIEAALDSGVFQEVMVSTEDEKIARVALGYGAKVPFFRSIENSDDFSTTSDVLMEVIRKYEEQGEYYDYGVCIYPTAPFLTKEKIKNAMDLLISSGADTVMPVVKFSFPPQRGLIIEENILKMKWPENLNVRSQDLVPFYHDCGQYYAFNISSFLENKVLLSNNTVPVISSELEVQDIDNINDWKLAEIKYRMLHERSF